MVVLEAEAEVMVTARQVAQELLAKEMLVVVRRVRHHITAAVVVVQVPLVKLAAEVLAVTVEPEPLG